LFDVAFYKSEPRITCLASCTLQNLPEFEGKKFQNVAKEGLQLDDSEKAKEYKKQLEEDFKPLTEWLNTEFKEQIEKAVVSSRLTDSPSALVSNQYGWSANMERVMRAQAYARSDGSDNEHYLKQKKIFEVNPYHPLIKKLLALIKEDEGADEKVNQDKAHDLAKYVLVCFLPHDSIAILHHTLFLRREVPMVVFLKSFIACCWTPPVSALASLCKTPCPSHSASSAWCVPALASRSTNPLIKSPNSPKTKRLPRKAKRKKSRRATMMS
jgi:hypothetical protein